MIMGGLIDSFIGVHVSELREMPRRRLVQSLIFTWRHIIRPFCR